MGKFFKCSLLTASLFICSGSFGNNHCSVQALLVDNPHATEICHVELKTAFGYDSQAKRVLWAAHDAPKDTSTTKVLNTGRYLKSRYLDDEIELSASSFSQDYDKVPLAFPSSIISNQAYSDLAYSMINIYPLDRSVWRGQFGEMTWELASWERSLFLERGTVQVISGLIWNEKIPKSRQQEPAQLYKIYYEPNSHLTLAYLIPTKKNLNSSLDIYITSISCIESKSGNKFFSKLPDELRNRVVSAKARNKEIWARPSKEIAEAACG